MRKKNWCQSRFLPLFSVLPTHDCPVLNVYSLPKTILAGASVFVRSLCFGLEDRLVLIFGSSPRIDEHFLGHSLPHFSADDGIDNSLVCVLGHQSPSALPSIENANCDPKKQKSRN